MDESLHCVRPGCEETRASHMRGACDWCPCQGFLRSEATDWPDVEPGRTMPRHRHSDGSGHRYAHAHDSGFDSDASLLAHLVVRHGDILREAIR